MRFWIAAMVFCAGIASASLPRLALLETSVRNLSPAESRQIQSAIVLELSQSPWIRLITEEEKNEAFQALGESGHYACLRESCHRTNAEILDAELLAYVQTVRLGTEVAVTLTLRSGLTGKVIESLRYRKNCLEPGDLTLLMRSAVAQTLGSSQALSGGVEKDTTSARTATASWIGGALAIGSGFALAGFLHADQFLQKDNNTLDSGFLFAKDGRYHLSGIQGFFFGARDPHARIRGMGGSGVSLQRAQGAERLNPAGVSGIQASQVSFSAATLPAGSGEQFTLGWNMPGENGIWWSHGMRFEGDDLASEFSFTTAAAWDFSIFANWLTGIIGGVRLKALTVQIGSNGTGIARSTGSGIGASTDFGLQWQIWNGPRLGFVVDDLWSQVRYYNSLTGDTYYEDLPQNMTLGVSWSTPQSTLISFDLRKAILNGQKDRFMFGMEQNLFDVLAIRGGYIQVLDAPSKFWTLGASARANAAGMKMGIDLATEIGSIENASVANKRVLTLVLEF